MGLMIQIQGRIRLNIEPGGRKQIIAFGAESQLHRKPSEVAELSLAARRPITQGGLTAEGRRPLGAN